MPAAIYEAWRDSDGVALNTHDYFRMMRKRSDWQKDAEFLYSFVASTGEEARAIHSLRMGWGAYHPIGDPSPCPTCDAMFYPQGSCECWRCGRVPVAE